MNDIPIKSNSVREKFSVISPGKDRQTVAGLIAERDSGIVYPEDSLISKLKISESVSSSPFSAVKANGSKLLQALSPYYSAANITLAPRKIPLFETLPGLEKNVKRLELVKFPTPVQNLGNLEKALGTKANLFIKRDDLTSPLYGGNKARKLEFTMGDVLAKGSKRIITGGGLGSHMTVSMAAFAKQYNITTDVVLFQQPVNEHVKTNMLLDKYFGANMEYSSNYAAFAVDIAKKYMEGLVKDGKPPYLILPGDSNALADLGYVNAAFEIRDQVKAGKMPEPDYIFVAAGSCGTMAGLLAGLRIAGLKTKVVGIQVSEQFVTNEGVVARLAEQQLRFIEKNSSVDLSGIHFKKQDVIMLNDYLGGGYGHSTEKAEKAIELLKNSENIKLDPTYTGKAMAAMIDFSALPQNAGKNIMFIDTYNSRDLSKEAASVDYLDLPKDFRKFFGPAR
jgi:1-aminocyclopropane-1-carboxylate deaminase/D-cysteine desulfhydrase-like pyridoxal-dependent ACC family enzyme